ncbi:hypothetical protein AMECASPLE_000857 [Ameca splendens]|uniref:Uncharacterized protein n=2 Tax=Goodeidae TaxID=28758 RepID=A0ABV0P2D0_9TELE
MPRCCCCFSAALKPVLHTSIQPWAPWSETVSSILDIVKDKFRGWIHSSLHGMFSNMDMRPKPRPHLFYTLEQGKGKTSPNLTVRQLQQRSASWGLQCLHDNH